MFKSVHSLFIHSFSLLKRFKTPKYINAIKIFQEFIIYIIIHFYLHYLQIFTIQTHTNN